MKLFIPEEMEVLQPALHGCRCRREFPIYISNPGFHFMAPVGVMKLYRETGWIILLIIQSFLTEAAGIGISMSI
jgi:hypothetical protein